MTFLFSSALDDGFQIEFLQCVLCACACRRLPQQRGEEVAGRRGVGSSLSQPHRCICICVGPL